MIETELDVDDNVVEDSHKHLFDKEEEIEESIKKSNKSNGAGLLVFFVIVLFIVSLFVLNAAFPNFWIIEAGLISIIISIVLMRINDYSYNKRNDDFCEDLKNVQKEIDNVVSEKTIQTLYEQYGATLLNKERFKPNIFENDENIIEVIFEDGQKAKLDYLIFSKEDGMRIYVSYSKEPLSNAPVMKFGNEEKVSQDFDVIDNLKNI